MRFARSFASRAVMKTELTASRSTVRIGALPRTPVSSFSASPTPPTSSRPQRFAPAHLVTLPMDLCNI